MSKIDMSGYVVRSEDGSVNLDATVGKFADDLQEYLNGVEADSKLCSAAVNAVFDQHIGVSINMPALQSLGLAWINANVGTLSPSEYVPLGEKIADHVRNHKDLYLVAKGVKGGVRRICDIPPKA
jgi:hypothetical protein